MVRFYLQHCVTLEIVLEETEDGREVHSLFYTEKAARDFCTLNGLKGYKAVAENV